MAIRVLLHLFRDLFYGVHASYWALDDQFFAQCRASHFS